MYQKPIKSLEELTGQRKSLIQQIVDGANLDYLAMEKLQKQLAQVNKEIVQRQEEIKEVNNE